MFVVETDHLSTFAPALPYRQSKFALQMQFRKLAGVLKDCCLVGPVLLELDVKVVIQSLSKVKSGKQ
jgi:hypothetical protein